jgi:hypothetical protein
MAVCYLVKAWMSIPKECIANCPGKKTGLLNLKNPINAEAIPGSYRDGSDSKTEIIGVILIQ